MFNATIADGPFKGFPFGAVQFIIAGTACATIKANMTAHYEKRLAEFEAEIAMEIERIRALPDHIEL